MFEIFDGQRGGYYWHLKSTNGEILCHSEILTTKQNALNGIASVKRIAADAPVYDRTRTAVRAS